MKDKLAKTTFGPCSICGTETDETLGTVRLCDNHIGRVAFFREKIRYAILGILHERVGRCTHCGRRSCEFSDATSLPRAIPWEDLKAALDKVLPDK